MSFSGAHAIAHGDVLSVLRELPDNEFDALLCDPPYGFSFMGKKWDYDVPSVEVWREALRVLKPGAALIAFGGTRTFHRVAVNIEDAGFELRDCLSYMYGTGFPKSLNFGCKCGKQTAKREVRSVSSSDVSTALSATEAGGEVLLASVPKQGTSAEGPVSSARESRTEERRVEGRSHVQAEQGELHRAEVRPLPGRVPQDVPQGRVRDGASTRDGSAPAPLSDENGGGTSSGPQSQKQRAAEPGAVRQQRGAQACGSKCQTCGGIVGWESYGTALKPAWEPAILARKPLEGTVAQNVAKWGCGALAIDACRIGTGRDKTPAPTSRGDSQPWFTTGSQDLGGDDSVGRWPANVCLDEEAGAALDEQSSPKMHSAGKARDGSTAKVSEEYAASSYQLPPNRNMRRLGDDGGASRFFYCAKVSTREREHGCASLPQRTAAEMTDSEEGQARLDSPRTGAGRGGGARNHHPTLKPIALAKWLARLIMPPSENATLLVPFSGAGSEMIGALEAGWPMVFGIEGEAEYIDIAHARIAAWAKGKP